jgi:transcription elongation GreA/GreB family factor
MSKGLRVPELARPAQDGEAEIGERVTVLDLTTSVVRDYRLVGTADGGGAGDVPIGNPLGSALLGSHVGDIVSVGDGDRTIRLEVVEIDG